MDPREDLPLPGECVCWEICPLPKPVLPAFVCSLPVWSLCFMLPGRSMSELEPLPRVLLLDFALFVCELLLELPLLLVLPLCICALRLFPNCSSLHCEFMSPRFSELELPRDPD